jgi:hypothetical protein
MIRLLAHHLSRQQVISLSQSSCVSPVWLNDGKGGRGAKSYDRGKTWPSITLSTLSVPVLRFWIRILFNQLDPDPHWEYGSGSGSRGAKINHKSEKNSSFEVLDIFF